MKSLLIRPTKSYHKHRFQNIVHMPTVTRPRYQPVRCSTDEARESFKSLYYRSSYPLTGPELKSILRNRQVRITRRGQDIVMHLLPEDWAVPDVLWDNLALVLNDWSATSIIRDKVPLHLSIAGDDEPISLSLNVQVRNDTDDWVDHA